jgi:hypothetical protein
MELSIVEIPRAGARRQAAEYARQAKHTRDEQVRAEFEQLARAYRAAARDDVALISLSSTIVAGGTLTRTLVTHRDTANERRENSLLPRLAVCRSSARFAFSLGVQRDGGIEFIDRLRSDWRYRSGRVRVQDGSFELPAGYVAGRDMNWTNSAWSALVPIVPPRHLPRVNADLTKLLTLWEVEDWTWGRDPAAPQDPALLQHLAGDLYAVLATWDLTELERLVLSGRTLSS